jgi:hypothetical protein
VVGGTLRIDDFGVFGDTLRSGRKVGKGTCASKDRAI